ncbi:hypothetical protein L207DRAFT_582728 [Hyaloscypha variabilis F]|uniref:BHLH domain-containing protein n=1 Tax=Hyaloscypha variabilis (strain UAMH 11265 / GT02V1 / F) TaxID=1149755 RepID=A0A2J6RPU9_HYAVF|nr:hypothetical protein L207DRAFT_582728 [Hyaloscypha variabilis F]
MDAAWPNLMGVDPRDLLLNRTESYDLNISPQENSSNGIQNSDDSWPSVQASTGGFMPTALAGPHLEIGVFDVEMPALGGNYQINGAPVLEHDDVWYLQSHQEDFVGIRNSTPSIDLTSQQPLPPFLCPLVEQVPNEIPQFSNQDQHTMTVHPPANNQGSQVPSSAHTLSRVSPQARRTRRPRRGHYVRASRTLPSRSITSPIPRSRRPVPPQKLVPAFSDCTQGSAPTGAKSVPSTQSSGELTIERSDPNSHTTALREAIRLTRESIKPFSPFSRRKATDLIKQVVELIDQLDQLAIEEEKYGNASSDDEESIQPSTAASSQDTLSNSDLVDVDSETDNTSISSTSHPPIVDGQNSVSVEDDQREPVHRPCLQCGHKSLYYCTREGCKYSTHSPAEWKRHEESQKHSQRERFMCLECPQSPPATDMNGDSVCEFCRTSFPDLGTNLTAHYLQCQSAQKSCTTYGRKDRLIAHLRTQHRINAHVSHIAAAGKFTTNCEWPCQCGFCGVTFMTWHERMDHIASHFEDGLDMSSWKSPLPHPKDPHPGLKPKPKDGDDSDDDMNDNDSRPSRYRAGIRDKANPSPSNQTNTSTQQKGRGASGQGGRKHRQQATLADLDAGADSDATSITAEVRGTLAAEQVMHGKSVSRLKTTSVALDRYLNDVEEPFQVRTIPADSVLALKKLTTYSAFTIRKCRPRDPKKEVRGTWARSEITEERWAQEDIVKRIKKLNDSPRSVADKKRALMPYQQGQVTTLIDNLASGEHDSVFEWSLVQLDSITKPFSILKGGKKREMYETVIIIAFIKRAPRKGHNHSIPLEDKEKWPKGGNIFQAHQAGSWPALQSREMERRRRRESSNLLEQRKRENVNESMQTLRHLISICQLKVNRNTTTPSEMDDTSSSNDEAHYINPLGNASDGPLTIPNFKTQVQRLNPSMDSRHNWLVSKIAHQQEERYKSLFEMRIKYYLAALKGDCAVEPHCTNLGGSATVFHSRDNQKEGDNKAALLTEHGVLQAVPDFSDDFDTGGASLTDETFSLAPLITCSITSQSPSKHHRTPKSASAVTYGEFLPEYQQIIDGVEVVYPHLVEAYNDEPLYRFDLGGIIALFLVRSRCRDRKVRDRAVHFLNRNKDYREGMWDTGSVGAILNFIIEVEEEKRDQCGEIAEDDKVSVAKGNLDIPHRRGLIILLRCAYPVQPQAGDVTYEAVLFERRITHHVQVKRIVSLGAVPVDCLLPRILRDWRLGGLPEGRDGWRGETQATAKTRKEPQIHIVGSSITFEQDPKPPAK